MEGKVVLKGKEDYTGAKVFLDGELAQETGADGSFSFLASPGDHILEIRAPGYRVFRKEISVAKDETTELGEIPLSETNPDVNGDGKVDAGDLSSVAQKFGSRVEQDPADVNGDGIIDIFDLVEIGRNFSKSGTDK